MQDPDEPRTMVWIEPHPKRGPCLKHCIERFVSHGGTFPIPTPPDSDWRDFFSSWKVARLVVKIFGLRLDKHINAIVAMAFDAEIRSVSSRDAAFELHYERLLELRHCLK